MPFKRVLGLSYVTLNPRFSDEYWVEITKQIRYDYGVGKLTDPVLVRRALDDIYSLLIGNFIRLTAAATDLTFLMFVHQVHEGSVFISQAVHSEDPDIDETLTAQDLKEMPSIRRVLKLVLESLLRERYDEEITPDLRQKSKATAQNVARLEELLYLGAHALEIKEHINVCSMYPTAVNLKSSWKKRLIIYTENPYKALFDTVQRDIATYENITYEEAIEQLETVLTEAFGNSLNPFLGSLPQMPGTYLVPKQDCIAEHIQAGRTQAEVLPFYAGLTLTAANKLSLGQSFQKMQSNYRFTYRPILEFSDRDGNVYWMMGFAKAVESIHILQSSVLLWAQQLPAEWRSPLTMKRFINVMEAKREAIMLERLGTLLQEHQVLFDISVKSLRNAQGQGFRIDTPGLGEIDLLFIDEAGKTLYVCECKNNRPRQDMFYWRGDHQHFVVRYEAQLRQKYEWVAINKPIVQAHFNYKLAVNLNFSDWSVKPLFLLMAPSMYKYDGLFPVLAIKDFALFLKNNFQYEYPTITFIRRDGVRLPIVYPYFKCITQLVQQGDLSAPM